MTDVAVPGAISDPLRALFDVDQEVPRLDGSWGPYINFDNAASTPPLRAVTQALDRFMPWYASVHRGTGFKSQLATHAYETARASTLAFVGADPATHVCVFGKTPPKRSTSWHAVFPSRLSVTSCLSP